jgi:hypothetical protein
VLQFAHGAAASKLEQPHWLLNDADAKLYATSIKNFARHFDARVTQKTIDTIAFLGCVAYMEGGRILTSINIKRRENAPARPSAQVFQFHQNPNPPGAAPAANAPPAPPQPGPMPEMPFGAMHMGGPGAYAGPDIGDLPA